MEYFSEEYMFYIFWHCATLFRIKGWIIVDLFSFRN